MKGYLTATIPNNPGFNNQTNISQGITYFNKIGGSL